MSELKMCDLCSGIGGCHLAGSLAGFRTVFAADIDAAARQVYEANLGLRPAGDLAGIDPDDVPGHDLLVAGMPCQPWSSAGDLGGVLYRLASKQPGRRNDLTSGQAARRSAAEEVARRFGVDERTGRRDARLADDLDAVASSLGDSFRRAVLSGEAKLGRKDIRDLAAMSDDERRRAEAGRGRRGARPKPPPAPVLDLAARLADLWRLAGREERVAFLRMVDIENILGEIMADA